MPRQRPNFLPNGTTAAPEGQHPGWSSPDASPVTGYFDSDTQILSFDETELDVTGGFGCTGDGRWVGDYLVTDMDDQSLDLFATGTE
jgi:hypothetical protein